MSFLIQKQENYIAIAKTTPGNCGFIEVFTQATQDSFQSHWVFMPTPNSPPIEFLNFSGQDQLLFIDQKLNIRTAELHSKTLSNHSHYDAASVLGAGLFIPEKKGFLAVNPHNRESVDILGFDIDTLQVRHLMSIPEISTITSVTVLGKNRIAGYLPAGTREKVHAGDGFIVID